MISTRHGDPSPDACAHERQSMSIFQSFLGDFRHSSLSRSKERALWAILDGHSCSEDTRCGARTSDIFSFNDGSLHPLPGQCPGDVFARFADAQHEEFVIFSFERLVSSRAQAFPEGSICGQRSVTASRRWVLAAHLFDTLAIEMSGLDSGAHPRCGFSAPLFHH